MPPQHALVHIMVTMSAADRTMSDSELARIGTIIRSLPIFKGFSEEEMVQVANACSVLLQKEDGIDEIVANAKSSLPENLRETAYALAVDVAAADLIVEQEELRFLEILRHQLEVDRLTAAAIERGARARHQVIRD